jgi:hypothetical protein
VELSPLFHQFYSASVAIAAVLIFALLVILCVGMTALLRCKQEDIPNTLLGIAALFRAVCAPWRRETPSALDKPLIPPPRMTSAIASPDSENSVSLYAEKPLPS